MKIFDFQLLNFANLKTFYCFIKVFKSQELEILDV
mgnify:CR=1 FL=1